MKKLLEKKHIPIWLMRQAGRHLEEYCQVRAQTKSFLEFCYDAPKAAQVTMQPVERYDMDAAILFSDILVLPHCLGWDVSFEKGVGPKLATLKDKQDLELLRNKFSNNILQVYEAIRLVKDKLPEEKTLIGFAGSPWTVATYMIEGRGKQDFARCKEMLYNQQELILELIDILSDRTIEHLSNQIEAGVDMVQLFDSWAGVLNGDLYQKMVIDPTKKIVSALKNSFPEIKITGFPRGSGHNYEKYIEQTGIDVVGVDQFVPVEKMAEWKKRVVVQGNLDPVVLLSEDKKTIKRAVDDIVSVVGRGNFIFNLGHGVLPQTPVENVKFLVDYVKRI